MCSLLKYLKEYKKFCRVLSNAKYVKKENIIEKNGQKTFKFIINNKIMEIVGNMIRRSYVNFYVFTMSYYDSHLFLLIYFSYHSMHFGIDSFDIDLSSFEKS